MSHQHAFIIPKQSDKLIVEGIRRALDAAGVPWSEIRATNGMVAAGNFVCNRAVGDLGEISSLEGHIHDVFSCALTDAFHGYGITVNRQPELAHDKVHFTWNGQGALSDEDKPKIANLQLGLERELRAFRLQDSLGKLMGRELQQHYEEREASLVRLEVLSSRFLEDLARRQDEISQTLEAKFTAKEAALHAEVQSMKEAAEAAARSRSEALSEREAALEKRISEIDDRTSRHARREIRRELQETIKARTGNFRLTKDTRAMRWPINILCTAILLSFGWAIWYSISGQITDVDTTQKIIRQIFLGVGFSSTAVFYVRWLNDWFQQHAKEEFKLKRLELDLDRASWVVEMAMEWKDEKGGAELPLELMQTLSRNLFQDGDVKPMTLHPADQLASALLGASSEANVVLPGGSSLKLDRKGVGQLQKD